MIIKNFQVKDHKLLKVLFTVLYSIAVHKFLLQYLIVTKFFVKFELFISIFAYTKIIKIKIILNLFIKT